MPGLQNPKCYARALGGCCRQIDREHYVSESILKLIYERFGKESQFVPVSNLAFQKSNLLERIGIGDLTAKILCRNHHAILSPFDSVGKAMFVAMDAMNESALNPQSPAATAHIDGDLFERWMLKTLYGGLYSGNFHPRSMKGVCPPRSWLEVVLGGADFPTGAGLRYTRQSSETVTTDPLILRIAPWISTSDHAVKGIKIWLFGFQFVLQTEPLDLDDANSFDEAFYRPEGFRETNSGSAIRFNWKNGPVDEEVRVQSLGQVN